MTSTLTYWFYVPVDNRDRLVGDLSDLGLVYEDWSGPYEDGTLWLVLMIGDARWRDDHRGLLDAIAKSHGGEYDGWETAVLPLGSE